MSVRVAAVGDIHVGVGSHDELRSVVERVGDEADLLLFAGDYTRWGTAEEAAVFASEVEGVAIPMFGVLGNHDFQSDENKKIVDILEEVGVRMLERDAATIDIDGTTIGIAGAKGFGGGFLGACGADFGEPEMKAFVRHTQEIADGFLEALRSLDTDVRIALLHYSPVPETLVGEKLEIYPWLGSYLLGQAVDRGGADLVVHGHAHAGSFEGKTPEGIPVYNVAQQVLGKP
ncbi:MAG: metallophosphoesterase, partial [Actinobacteria bacterium]|nr:metallophosphoesterase [Actinomycetota bacterium]